MFTRLDISTFTYETATISRSVGHLSPNDAAQHPDENGKLKRREM